MKSILPAQSTRRQFIATAGSAICSAPFVLSAQKTESRKIVGDGEHQFEVIHDWLKLPDQFTWQTTHNVAVDQNGSIYVIHEGHRDQADHPSIFVFDSNGQYIRSFGSEYQGGGHGLEIRTEGNEQFLYVTAYKHLKRFAKLTLTGELVWERRAPMVSERYAECEAEQPRGNWGRNRFMPTNFAFHPDGGFYVADGYGAYCIHRYDKDANYQSTIGRPGKGPGEFQLPHGVWLDSRNEGAPTLVVADRVNARLQWFSLDGKHLSTVDGFILPANVDTHKDLMVVPDLSARVTLLNKKNEIVAHLGEDSDWRTEVLKDNRKLRTEPDRWRDGRFLHPHDACFDLSGNIIVAEYVSTGRVTLLKRLA
jgi:hypothetical protein